MKKTKFSVDIHAPAEKVWTALWDDTTYREWNSVFSEGSHAESDWNEGDKISFLDGKGEGMFSTIAQKIPNEFMLFRHLGVVKNGKEEPLDEETKKWSGAEESYTLKDTNGSTNLAVEIDITEDFEKYFSETFPKALNKLKEIAEK